MSTIAARPKMTSIFVKIALIIAATVGLVIGTTTIYGKMSAKRLTTEFVSEEALFSSELIGQIIAGAVKFGKTDQINGVLEQAAANLDGQLTTAVVLGADGQTAGQYGQSTAVTTSVAALAKRALAAGQVASSEDGLAVAVPLYFGADNAVVGVLATDWTPEQMLQRTQEESRRSLLWAGVMFIVAVLLAMLLCARLIVRPLNQTRDAIGGLGEARYDTDIPGLRRRDEIGDIGRSLATLRDKLSASEAIRREASFKGAAFMGCSAALMVVDASRTVRYLNPKMLSLFGQFRDLIPQSQASFDPATLVGRSIDVCKFGDTNVGDVLKNASGQSTETIVRLGDVHLALAVSAVRDDEGHPLGHVLEWANVTDDILNRATLAAIEANQLKAEFAMSGNLISVNAAFTASMKASAPALLGSAFNDLVISVAGEPGGPARILEEACRGNGFIGQLDMTRPDGERVIVDGSVTPVCNDEGHPVRLLLLGSDVTGVEAELRAGRLSREEAERHQAKVVEALRIGLEKLSRGDLTAKIASPFSGTYEQLRSDFNGALETLAQAMSDILRRAESIHNEARDISSTADGLSRRTENNSATLEETAAALDTLTASVRTAAAGADQADSAVAAAKANAENSGNVVLETVSAMDQIAESSEKITSIIKVIDDIAFQTNLLALNAGVEAARAGDAGRGFAVVASEVRALAQRSSNAAREINDLIAKSATQVKTGVTLVGRTGQALRQIVESVSEISMLVSDIAASSRQQSASLAEINNAVNQLDQSTQQNAARLEETTAASESLRQDAVSLVDSVARFRVADEARETAGVIRPKTAPMQQRPASQATAAASAPPPATRPARANAGAAVPKPAIEVAESQWEDF